MGEGADSLVNKLIAFFTAVFLLSSLLSGIMEGGGMPSATPLTAELSETGTTATVTSTEGFLDSDFVVIEDEQVGYSGKTATTFTGLDRAQEGTLASTHASGKMVYSEVSSLINYSLGFSVTKSVSDFGLFSIAIIPFQFFTKTVPHLVSWDYSFLQGDLTLVRTFLQAISIGLLVALAISIAGAFIGRIA